MSHWSSEETAERALSYLHERRDEHGEVEASLQEIAEALHNGRMTAQRAIRRLIDGNAVSVSRRGNGPLYPTCYRVLRDPNERVLRRARRLGARAAA